MTLLRFIFKALAWIVAGVFAGALVLVLYAPGLLDKLLLDMNIDTGGQNLVVWAAFVLGALIVLAGFVGAVKQARQSDRLNQRKPGELTGVQDDER
ncbi:MAG: hypothetical protein QM667_00215 [Asticcacaulis sp.]